MHQEWLCFESPQTHSLLASLLKSDLIFRAFESTRSFFQRFGSAIHKSDVFLNDLKIDLVLERFVLFPLQSHDDAYSNANEEGSEEDHRKTKVVGTEWAACWTLRIHLFVVVDVIRAVAVVKEVLHATAIYLSSIVGVGTVLVVVSLAVSVELLAVG